MIALLRLGGLRNGSTDTYVLNFSLYLVLELDGKFLSLLTLDPRSTSCDTLLSF